MDDLIGNNIDLTATVKSKTEALQAICARLEETGVVSDKDRFYRDVLAREAIGPTGMEHGIAIPHGESPAAQQAAIAVLKTENDLAWESLDDQPVHLVFMLVVPTTGRNTEHLKILAHLSAALTHPDVQRKLLATTSVREFKQILAEAGGI